MGTQPVTIALVAAAALVLAGCNTPSPAPRASATADGSPSEEPSPSANPSADPVFRMPTACAAVLPASRVAEFAGLGRELLAGPDGKYGDTYFADPTPEQLAGGITCLWGEENAPENSVIVSVAPLDDVSRGATIEALVEQGLNERVDGENLVYERTGDDVAAPAIVNVIADDSWVSVIEGSGGQESYEDAVELCDEVAAEVGA